MYYIKNYSQIKILKIPEILTKISKTTGLDHIYKGYLSPSYTSQLYVFCKPLLFQNHISV